MLDNRRMAMIEDAVRAANTPAIDSSRKRMAAAERSMVLRDDNGHSRVPLQTNPPGSLLPVRMIASAAALISSRLCFRSTLHTLCTPPSDGKLVGAGERHQAADF